MFNIGVIGYGMSAQTFHIPLIHHEPQLRLAAIASSKTDLALAPDVRLYHNPEALIADPELDAVVITAPNDVHAPLAQAALNQGKHVVLEKPMVTCLADGQRLLALAQAQKKQLAVFHNRRFDDDFLSVAKLLADGVLGEVKTFHSHWDRFRPNVRARWREQAGAGAGIWFDLGPHLLDQALALFGLPQAVTARLSILRARGQSDDYAHVQLHYPAREVILSTSPFNNAPTLRFRAEGSLATFQIYGLDPQEAQLKAGLTPADARYGWRSASDYGVLYRDNQAPEILPCARGDFTRFYANFAASIAGDASLLIPADAALAVMQVLEAAIASSAQGKTLEIA